MRLLLDSGDPQEYKVIQKLAKEKGSEIWGSTTNPTLIAKSAALNKIGKKITTKEASELQKQLVLEILTLVPGAVSAEVYADSKTKASEMVEQGMEIATWDKRVVVKLPTTLEGFKARSQLRKAKIPINNTLVFSQEQIFAICLHEQVIQKNFGPIHDLYPPFISPFVGRLDDININGIELVQHGITMKKKYAFNLWMLEASVRSIEHITQGFILQAELLTAPAKTYEEWFNLNPNQLHSTTQDSKRTHIPYWDPKDLIRIQTEDDFFSTITNGKLSINHELTDKGLEKFASDWNAIIAS